MILSKDRAISSSYRQLNNLRDYFTTSSTYDTLTVQERITIKKKKVIPSSHIKKERHTLKYYNHAI